MSGTQPFKVATPVPTPTTALPLQLPDPEVLPLLSLESRKDDYEDQDQQSRIDVWKTLLTHPRVGREDGAPAELS
jgi:hypothetical protein